MDAVADRPEGGSASGRRRTGTLARVALCTVALLVGLIPYAVMFLVASGAGSHGS